MLDLVKQTSEVMLSSLPNFWKIASSFMEGKFKKVSLFFSSYPETDGPPAVVLIFRNQAEPNPMQVHGPGHREALCFFDFRILHSIRHGCEITKPFQYDEPDSTFPAQFTLVVHGALLDANLWRNSGKRK